MFNRIQIFYWFLALIFFRAGVAAIELKLWSIHRSTTRSSSTRMFVRYGRQDMHFLPQVPVVDLPCSRNAAYEDHFLLPLGHVRTGILFSQDMVRIIAGSKEFWCITFILLSNKELLETKFDIRLQEQQQLDCSCSVVGALMVSSDCIAMFNSIQIFYWFLALIFFKAGVTAEAVINNFDDRTIGHVQVRRACSSRCGRASVGHASTTSTLSHRRRRRRVASSSPSCQASTACRLTAAGGQHGARGWASLVWKVKHAQWFWGATYWYCTSVLTRKCQQWSGAATLSRDSAGPGAGTVTKSMTILPGWWQYRIILYNGNNKWLQCCWILWQYCNYMTI